MISALLAYAGREVVPRLLPIIRSSELLVAALAGVLFAIFGDQLPIAKTTAGNVVLAVLAYAAIAFGFSVAGLTLVLTGPDPDLASVLAWSDPSTPGLAEEPPRRSSYSNLLFIFSWTAVAHWLVVVASIALLVGLGSETQLLAEGSSLTHTVAVGLVAGLTVYAVEMFLVTVITLSAVGDTQIRRLQKRRPQASETDGSPPLPCKQPDPADG